MSLFETPLAHKPDYLVCTCMGVMHSEIIAAIGQGHDSFQALQENLLVGTGCSSCVAEVQELVTNNHLL